MVALQKLGRLSPIYKVTFPKNNVELKVKKKSFKQTLHEALFVYSVLLLPQGCSTLLLEGHHLTEHSSSHD